MDRLAQFRAASGALLHASPPAPGSNQMSPVTTTITVPPTSQDLEAAQMLEEFYKTVYEVDRSIDSVERLTRELAEKHSKIMSTVDMVKCNVMRTEAEGLANRINDLMHSAGKCIEMMKVSAEGLRKAPAEESRFIGVIRIEENQRRYALHRLNEAMKTYQRQQNTLEKRYRSQAERQIKIKYTNPDGTAIDDTAAQELAQAVVENNITSCIFQQSKDVLAQIIETRNDILRIEQSMRSLNQLFNDLAFLVHEQGEVMDMVLKNIGSATRFLETGRAELKKACKYQKRSRKKICCIVVILSVIVGVFFTAILLGSLL